jgi:hypothetical protein
MIALPVSRRQRCRPSMAVTAAAVRERQQASLRQ